MNKSQLSRSATFLLGVFQVLFFLACSGSPKSGPGERSEPPAPPEPVTARFAFQRMSIQARTWAADAQPLRIASVNLKEVPAAEGRYPAWRATFVSQQLGKSRSYSYSVVDSGANLHEGVLRGAEEYWSGPTGQARPFPVQMLKVDSDQACEVAGGESKSYIKQHPDMPVHFLLEYTPRFPLPTWRVVWGQTVGSSNYSVFVDCVTGKYLQTLH